MLNELSDIWGRLKVHWHAVAVALIAALPVILQQLDGIDLRPILAQLLPAQYVDLVIALLPFLLLVMKPMLHMEEPASEE
jgi:hypothetical protein